MTFRVQGKYFFNTYPQCNLSKEAIKNFYLELLPNIEKLIVAEELHQDGNTHIHVLFQHKTRLNIRNERYFDIDDYHPNITSVRNLAACTNYIKKDNNYLEYSIPTIDNSLYTWDNSMTEAEFYAKGLEEKIPFQYVDHAFKLLSKPSLTLTETPPKTVSDPLMLATLRDFQWDWTQTRNLVISGASGIGKTTWVKANAPKPALWITHMDCLNTYREGYHKSLIFDDMSFQHLPREAQIHLVDSYDTRTIHVRYRTVTIPAGIPRVFTTNLRSPFSEDDAISRRIKIHHF